jgi:hypothetical protein
MEPELQHGCRSEYGPLELRIQIGASTNGFTIFVEDRRLEHAGVYEHPAQSTLDCAKESAVLHANEYLTSRQEAAQHAPEWRCS